MDIHRFGLATIVALALLAGFAGPVTAAPETKEFQCGKVISSAIKTATGDDTSIGTAFATIAGGSVQVVVPPDKTRCVKVTFSAVAACVGVNLCDIRALVDGSALYPHLGSVGSFTATGGPLWSPRTFQWVRRIGAGTHVVAIQSQGSAGPTDLRLRGWTMNVEVTNAIEP